MASEHIFVAPTLPIVDAIRRIEEGGHQIVLVVDEHRRLLGTVTDGDVRRGMLKSTPLDAPVRTIMKANPHTAMLGSEDAELLRLMRNLDVRQMPLLDFAGRVVDMRTLDELLRKPQKPNWVVLMAGGLGTRLRPLTEHTPKPMLAVGGRPLLQTILEAFVEHGFSNFFISVNYHADMIRRHFGDGGRWGVQIRYLDEKQRMGTAGSLALLPEAPSAPFFIMNGDILTSVNFEQMLQFHLSNDAMATIAVHEHSMQVPYGVVEVHENQLVRITEKPVQHHFINAGIYILSPPALERIPRGSFFDMPTLVQTLLEEHQKVVAFPIWEYWLDIGQPHDLQRAESEYARIFA